jgi:hypothetical protein
LAVDVSGSLAALSFEAEPEAAELDELQLSVPLLAVPTLRGVARVAPGTPLPSPAPLWLELDAAGGASSVWCSPSAALAAQVGASGFGVRRSNSTRTVEAVER